MTETDDAPADRTRIKPATSLPGDGEPLPLPPPENVWQSLWPWGYIAAGFMAAALGSYLQRWQHRPLAQPPGVEVAPNGPHQETYATPGTPFHIKDGVTLTPRADFTVTARVLGTEHYRYDAPAKIIPVDLGLGWGRMSDSAVLARIDFSQSDRFLWWHTKNHQPLPIAASELITSATNIHPIAATEDIARSIDALRPGQIVRLSGRLVDLEKPDGYQLPTSLSRNDSGAGACEVLYVESLQVLVHPPAAEENTVRGMIG